MNGLDLVLDHVGVAVEDLYETQAFFQKLGFNLTDRSIHSGSHEPGGPVKPLGSGNHCAMFEAGYLELLGVTDASLPNHAAPFLAKYPGAHIIAMGLQDAERAGDILKARNSAIQAPSLLERDALVGAIGPDGTGQSTARARFVNFYLDAGAIPEAYLIFIEHLTPDVLWQPHLLAHDNGVIGMQEVAICVENVADSVARWSNLLAAPAVEKMPGIHAIELSRGRIYIMDLDGLAKWAPGVTPPCLPWVAGFGLNVKDLAVTRDLLEGRGVTFEQHPYPAIWLRPENCLGVTLSFIQA